MSVPIFLINLDRSPDRLAVMNERFARLNLPFTRVQAVDGRDLCSADVDKVRIAVPGWKPLATNEVACFLSHRKCWSLIATGAADYGCIFEDDVVLSTSVPLFLSHDNWIPKRAEIVKLETNQRKVWLDRFPRISTGGFRLARLWSSHYNAGGYIVSRDAAKRLLDITERFAAPVDAVIFDRVFRLKHPIAIYQLIPSVCIQSNVVLPMGVAGRSESVIGDERGRPFRDNELSYRSWKIVHEACNVLHRLLLRKRSVVGYDKT